MTVYDGRDDEEGGHQDSRQGNFSRNGHQIFFQSRTDGGSFELCFSCYIAGIFVSQ